VTYRAFRYSRSGLCNLRDSGVSYEVSVGDLNTSGGSDASEAFRLIFVLSRLSLFNLIRLLLMSGITLSSFSICCAIVFILSLIDWSVCSGLAFERTRELLSASCGFFRVFCLSIESWLRSYCDFGRVSWSRLRSLGI